MLTDSCLPSLEVLEAASGARTWIADLNMSEIWFKFEKGPEVNFTAFMGLFCALPIM